MRCEIINFEYKFKMGIIELLNELDTDAPRNELLFE